MIRCPAFLPFQTSSSLLGFLSICISRFVSPNMESPIILNYFTSSLSCFCMILLYASTLNPVFALENCTFPAIFNFGDSNSDTGGLAAALITPTPPYGETFFHMPAGRFSDGRLIIDFMGGIYANLMPEKDYFPKALYTFDIGQNDIGGGSFSNMTLEEVNASVPDIVNNFSTNVKAIYDVGARSFWIHNTGPLGCLPYILTNFLSAQRDSHGCAKPYNDVAQYFNYKLKEAIVQLRIDLPLAAITHVDIYSAKYSLFSESNKHGFEFPLVACCGYGGKYNYSNSVRCGGTITVNGSQIFVGSCEHPSVRVNWDGFHYTEAANKFVFNQISTGAFSDPPIPLKMACHRV
ncbi:esterase-like isoform X2 [Corylus avellana]|uniref:esterase-like isoform X2 n=1 Tax=Corylus avellana TaxID=13451 RepID=UPI00286ABBDD|nr:esterase-like isoform X2 [Corylus avellana]